VLVYPVVEKNIRTEFSSQPIRSASLSSALLNSSVAIGDLLGPIVGGTFTEMWGFERASAVIGLFILFNGLVFLPVAVQ